MDERIQMYDWFARMLRYPNSGDSGSGFQSSAFSDAGSLLHPHCVQLTAHLNEFRKRIEHRSIEELEELYTRTFDINPIANLEIGWHLYGEQYERGEFLVMMRSLLREHSVEESSELPDHLTHILLALGRMKKEEADAFSSNYVIPSIEKITVVFNDTDNPYAYLLYALKSFLEQQQQFNESNFPVGVETHE